MKPISRTEAFWIQSGVRQLARRHRRRVLSRQFFADLDQRPDRRAKMRRSIRSHATPAHRAMQEQMDLARMERYLESHSELNEWLETSRGYDRLLVDLGF